MDDDRLIALVESDRELYDKTSPRYKNNDRKKAIWADIAEELQSTGEKCLRRWTTLRDKFGRESKKVSIPSGSGAVAENCWSLIDAMGFLKPFIIPRPQRCSQNILDSTCSPAPVLELKRSPQSSPSSFSLSPVLFPLSPESPIAASQPLPSPPQSSTTVTLPSPSPKRKKRKRSYESALENSFCEVVDLFKKICKAREAQSGNEAVFAFGKIITVTVSGMSPTKQGRAMQRLTDLAMEIQREPDS